MSQTFPRQLCGPRVLLRRLEPADAPVLSGYRSIPEVARYQSWNSFDLRDAARLIAEDSATEPNIPGTWFQLGIVEMTTMTLIGDCGLHCLERDPRQMEVGITLGANHQKRGYATEALRLALQFVFGTLGKHRVFAVTDAENRSAAALFTRLGFRQEAHHIENVFFKGHWGSELVFALLQREWEARCRQHG